MKKYLLLLVFLGACSSVEEKTEQVVVIKQDSFGVNDAQKVKEVFVPELNDTLDDIARIIAGMYVKGSLYFRMSESKSYLDFSEQFSKRWNHFDTSRLTKLKEFSQKELVRDVKEEPTLFYPFSGPDILYAYSFFPKASRFVLLGLEPVGTLPDFNTQGEDSLRAYFSQLNSSLNAILKFSFFRTHSMRKDLKNNYVDGTIHLLFLFLSRTGNGIVSARPHTFDSLGKKQYLHSFKELAVSDHLTKGVEIFFKTQEGEVKELNYYSLDAVDPALAKNKGFAAYLDSLEHFNTYLKGASYLLHKPYFSRVRNSILQRSGSVIQDDSGIALRYFQKDTAQWDFKLYGEYTRPVSLFKNAFQKDLDSLYKNMGATPLGFGIGYNFKDKNSNLMVAKRK